MIDFATKLRKMGWRKFLNECMGFTMRDRIGMIVILVMVFLTFIVPKIYFTKGLHDLKADTAWVTVAKSMEIQPENTTFPASRKRYPTLNSKETPVELFHFDPNSLDLQGWEKLGIRAPTIRTIQNFLSKGGSFKKAEDLLRIYGLGKEEFEKLKPFVVIETRDSKYTPNTQRSYVPLKPFQPKVIDINKGDTSDFIALPGVGSKLATRIIHFREKLGGFYSVNQVRETFGLVDSVFENIKPFLEVREFEVKKININTATLDELKAHPYLRYSIAKAIIAYRNEHGTFGNVEEIKRILPVTEEVYKKLVPYLEK
jgi:competence protein ComEA